MFRYPGFKVFNAPHEFLSQHDFRQGSFQNTFTLAENGEFFIAHASIDELTILTFDGAGLLRVGIENKNSTISLLNPSKYPHNITFSFCSMDYDRFFSMKPFSSKLELENIYVVENPDEIIIGLPHPDKAHCVVLRRDEMVPLVEPKPKRLSALKSLYCLACESAALGLCHAQYSHVA